MPDTKEEDKLRAKMLKVDKIIHLASNEFLLYIINKAIKEMERR